MKIRMKWRFRREVGEMGVGGGEGQWGVKLELSAKAIGEWCLCGS